MNRLWLLLKVELRETFFPSPEQDTTDTSKTKKKRKRNSGRSYLAMMITSTLIIVGFLSLYLVLLASPLQALGLLDVYPMLAVAGSSLFVLMTTIYKTNGMLFGFKDYDMVMALPFETNTIVACRFALLYIWNLAFTVAIMLPVGIIYGIFAQASVGFWVVYLIGMFLVPLVPCVLAALVGLAIAIATAGMPKRGIANSIVTVIVLVAWVIFCMSFSVTSNEESVQAVASAMPAVMSTLSAIYPPSIWFMQACCDLDMGMFALFAAVSLGVFAVFVFAIGKSFRAINARLKVTAPKASYNVAELKGQTPQKALVMREWKRLTGSSTYLLNTCIGYLMVAIFSILALVAKQAGMLDSLGASMREIQEFLGPHFHPELLAGMFFGMFMIISAPTVCAVSMEGKAFWISKTIPVGAWQILRAKLTPAFQLVTGVSVLSGVLLWATFNDLGALGVFFFLIPFSFGLFSLLFGLNLNLKYPDFNWTTETKIAKQGRPAMVMSFTGLGIGLGSFFCYMFFGDIVAIIAVCVLSVASFLLYRNLKREGVQKFEQCTG